MKTRRSGQLARYTSVGRHYRPSAATPARYVMRDNASASARPSSESTAVAIPIVVGPIEVVGSESVGQFGFSFPLGQVRQERTWR